MSLNAIERTAGVVSRARGANHWHRPTLTPEARAR